MKEEDCSLFYREGSSDKVYTVYLKQMKSKYSERPDNQGWVVDFAYGRRNSVMNTGSKTGRSVTYNEAKIIFDKLIKSKQAKGYTIDPDGKVFKGAIEESRDTGIRPQLLNECTEEEVEKLILNDSWCAQEKYDGRRILLFPGLGTGANRKGLTINLDDKVVKELKNLGQSTKDAILDGEDLGDRIILFDLIRESEKTQSYFDRYSELENALTKDNKVLQLAPVAWNMKEKRDLYKKLKKEGKEGIVFKNVHGLYHPGRPASGGDMLKYKFYSTCSCVVESRSLNKRSVSLVLFDEKLKPVNVGNVTVYPNQEIPLLGAVLEIKYLYAYPGGSLYQPVLLSERTDISRFECALSQLKLKKDDSEES